MKVAAKSITVAVDETRSVSGLLIVPPDAGACYVLAHGAGAGMSHPFMEAVAHGLAEHGIATLRYQFPYMERGSRRPDSSALAHATVRAAVAEATRQAPGLALIAGGKSFGGRMTSQAQAHAPLPDVRGLVFIGFPLHPIGKPSVDRAEHLFRVGCPMLLLQGTKDKLADMQLLRVLHEKLGTSTTLQLFDQANHSFEVPARSSLKQVTVMQGLLDATARWIKQVCVL